MDLWEIFEYFLAWITRLLSLVMGGSRHTKIYSIVNAILMKAIVGGAVF